MPVIPATQEAEAGELLEPGRQRLQLAEIVPLQPGQQRETLPQRKQNLFLQGWAWWLMPVIPAGGEAMVGELREFETSLGNMAKPHLYKKMS